jgi:hypothetical protein
MKTSACIASLLTMIPKEDKLNKKQELLSLNSDDLWPASSHVK